MQSSTTHSESSSSKAIANQDSSRQSLPVNDNKPEAAQLKEMKEMTQTSPRMAIQRQQFASAIGGATAGASSNETGMPDQLKSGLENMSGFDLSDVKVHYNSSKPAQLQALAYAQGNEIHLGPGQEKHLPHEGWHVVQQKQGRVQATMQMKGVAINDDKGLEKEADVMGEKALMTPGYALSSLNRSGNIISNKGLVSQTRIIQRVEVGERPFEQGYANVLNHPGWFEKAETYEKRLGSYLSRLPKASTTLHGALVKMLAVFEKYYVDEFKDDKQGIMRKLFFRDDKTSAGQIGLNLDVPKMLEVLGMGNLRERMTAFYNASYYGAGYGDNIKEGFKAILQDIVLNSKWGKSDELGLNTDSLKGQGAFMKGWSRSAIQKIIATIREESAYNYGPDIFALGNLAYQTDSLTFTNTLEIAESQKDRSNRPDLDKQNKQKTPKDYADMNVPLSDEELAYLFPNDDRSIMEKLWYSAEYIRRQKQANSKLSWEEGTALFNISPDNSWYKRIHDQLKTPVVAGVSGTTTRMLSAFKWLNTGGDPLNFRLAIMGWMLTSWDHSLYEILRGAHIAGVKGDNEEKTVTDVIRMYMNIPPLTVDELRSNVAERGMFPHELIYNELALEKDKAKPSAKVPGDSLSGDHVADVGKTKIYGGFGYKKAEYKDLTDAHAIAIHSYTSGAHNILNSAMSFSASPSLAKVAIKRKLSDIIDHYERLFLLRAKEANATITPDEKVELSKLNKKGVEWINVLTPKYQSIKMILGNPDMSDENRAKYKEDNINVWLDALIEDIYPELQMHANMTVEGLQKLPAVDGVTVWRGDWISQFSKAYNKGKTVDFSTFTSFSRSEARGKKFTQSGDYSYKMLISLDLKGKAGKDISGLSMYPTEEEILLMPGSKMQIKEAKWGKLGSDDVWMVEAEEI